MTAPGLKRFAVVALAAVAASAALAGCSDKTKDDAAVILPDDITTQDIERIGTLAAKFPTQFSFPGQALLEPLVQWINGTLDAGTGATGIELPNDDGPVDYGSEIIQFDVSDKVPVGQPVEVRINLKYWGDPGRAADLDIWVDMPGSRGAANPAQYDESNNWNIVNKARVVDSLHLDGQPFMVGLQVNNGRIADPAGVPYAMQVEFNFAKDVLAPGAAYAIQVPDNATGLVFKTDRITGDEHVEVSFLLIGPDDKLVRHLQHNDIGVDTLFLPVKQGGEYVIYAHEMQGGFVRLESEVPNERFLARLLDVTTTETVLHSDTPAPGTYAEAGLAGNTWGAEGTFDVGPGFPLDVTPFIRSQAGAVNAAIKVSSPSGWLATAFTCNWVAAQAPPYCMSLEDERGRVGSEVDVRHDRSRLATGPYTFGVVADNAGVQLGVAITGYTR